jgi:SAM-dependent methyltransferase
LVQGDIDRPLPFTHERFDVVLFAYSAYYADHANRLLAETARVLAPDGQVILIGPAPGNAAELDTIGEDVFGVAAAPAKDLRLRRLADQFRPILAAAWHAVSYEILDCSLMFPNVDAFVRYYRATPQYLELAAARGTRDERQIADAIGRLSGCRLTKKVIALRATRPSM